jgi:iron complex transport system substrate-binding protein
MKRIWILIATLIAAGAPLAAQPSTRVATLLPYVAEALGRIPEVTIVAAVAAELGGEVPEGAVDLGSPHAPNYEALAASRPDVVVGDRRFHGAIEEKLARSGARVILVEAASVDATLDGLIAVAAAAGVEAQMQRLVSEVREALPRLHLDRAASVLPLFGAPGSFMAITERTWLGDLLAELGFEILPPDLTGRESYPGYVEVSEEVLALVRPELVLLVTHGSPHAVAESFGRESSKGGPWARLAERVRVLDPALFARNPGLEMGRAAEELVRLLDEAQGPIAQAR